MLLLLASFRRWRDIEAARAKGEWIRERMHETIRTLEGATLVIAGFGSIGQEVARKAKAFDMRVVTVTRTGRKGPTVDEAVTRDRLHEVLPSADALVLCLPVEPGTVHFIGAAEFDRMKPDAVLVNVGRGELVDEAALVRALDKRRIGGAALDVTTAEPLPPDSPLWRMENVLISPHVAGTGKDGSEVFDKIFAENLARYRSGRPLLHAVAWDKADAKAVAI
jgi:phosphoglycerate dehydrogenase-like enzyme